MTNTNRIYERELNVAIGAVREASRLCRAVGAEISPEVLSKNDKSPVTVADFGSQALICRALKASFPDDPVIAEEDATLLRSPENSVILDHVLRHVRSIDDSVSGNRVTLRADHICEWIDHGGATCYHDRFWTIDPIDGTKGFLRGEQYAVALALIVAGEVVVAALACPHLDFRPSRERQARQGPSDHLLGAIFTAVKGEGAFVRPPDSPAGIEPVVSRLQVNATDDPAEIRFCESVESGHSAHGDAAGLARRLGITTAPLRLDSQAKYAVVARGDAEMYLRLPTRANYREKIWDHAAGTLIVSEAGGAVTDMHGHALEFHHGRELIANRGVIVSNGKMHGSLIRTIKEISTGPAA